MRRIFSSLVVFACIAGPAAAADLTVNVKGDDGMPLADAVVIIKAPGATPAAPIKFAWSMTMAQQNIAFNPYVLIVPVGSVVGFPNKDKVRHHVYSFSPTKKFELKLYGQDETRTVTFDKAGVVALGCNIHDSMIGYIYVTDSPFAAKTNAAGDAVIRNVPAGAVSMSIWHPDMKARAPVVTPAAGGGRKAVVLPMKPAAARHQH